MCLLLLLCSFSRDRKLRSPSSNCSSSNNNSSNNSDNNSSHTCASPFQQRRQHPRPPRLITICTLTIHLRLAIILSQTMPRIDLLSTQILTMPPRNPRITAPKFTQSNTQMMMQIMMTLVMTRHRKLLI
jgi:hypothetical protein